MGLISDSFARPSLLDAAPSSALDFVARLLRRPILREQTAERGFTKSVASIIIGEDGQELFVKAGPLADAGGQAVRAGVDLAAALGDLGAPLLSVHEEDGWIVAVYERLPGCAITEWTAADLDQLNRLSLSMRERLDPCTVTDTDPYAEAFSPLLGTWAALLEPTETSGSTVAHVRGRELPYGLKLQTLAELEADWFAVLRDGSALQHGDIRRDNVMREPSGRLRLVDWAHRWSGPGWADWVRLAPDT